MITPASIFYSIIMRKRERSGVSPVIATTILIAITVSIGLALWSFSISGVNTATLGYSDTVTEYGKFTSDKIVIANMDFNNPAANRISFWIFNSGKSETDLCAYSPTNFARYDPADPDKCAIDPTIVVTCQGCASPPAKAVDLCQYDAGGACKTWAMPDPPDPAQPDVPNLSIQSRQLGKFSFEMENADGTTHNIESGMTYELTVFSNTGASHTFLKKSG